MPLDHALQSGHFVWLLGSLCKLHRIPFDHHMLLQQSPPPHSLENVTTAAKKFGFKTGVISASQKNWPKISLPAISFILKADEMPEKQKDRSSKKEIQTINAKLRQEQQTVLPLIVLRADATQIIFIRPDAEKPEIVDADAFSRAITPQVILFSRPIGESLPSDDVCLLNGLAKFGFRWFIPELLKHKHIWRDILIASLCLQVAGLITPILTQVIIDKVVVHQTMSTLTVVGVALFLFMLFSST
jgi:subfamily B ATP-binding cassette protein HlyB/CyaB